MGGGCRAVGLSTRGLIGGSWGFVVQWTSQPMASSGSDLSTHPPAWLHGGFVFLSTHGFIGGWTSQPMAPWGTFFCGPLNPWFHRGLDSHHSWVAKNSLGGGGFRPALPGAPAQRLGDEPPPHGRPRGGSGQAVVAGRRALRAPHDRAPRRAARAPEDSSEPTRHYPLMSIPNHTAHPQFGWSAVRGSDF